MSQTSFTITNETDLNTAITDIDVGGRDGLPNTQYTIDIVGSIALNTPLLAINLAQNSTLDLQGSSNAILDGNNAQRGLLVYAGTVDVSDLTIQNAVAQGGAGGSSASGTNGGGGGGGAGLGGGLFVTGTSDGVGGASVTLDNVVFSNDAAKGGNGGTTVAGARNAGGGGGLGGNGGSAASASAPTGGGGGVGSGASGGSGTSTAGGTGIIPGAAAGGNANGGADGGGGGATGAGGGVGGHNDTALYPGGASSFGGSGGFGGGGGGGFLDGGKGGFGGGGGGGAEAAGGAGGFGGGGGGSQGTPGKGGFGGGGGAAHGTGNGGGGGLGAGGDIFVQSGGSLTIEGGSLSNGSVKPGAGQNGGGNGSAYGSGIFIQGKQDITFAPTLGETLTINDLIADEPGSNAAMTTTGAGGIIIDGAGTVIIDQHVNPGGSDFTGNTTLDLGTLDLSGGPNIVGTGSIVFGGPAELELLQDIEPPLNSSTFQNTLANFTVGDSLYLNDLVYDSKASSAVFSNGTLTVTEGSTKNSFTMTGVPDGTQFNAQQAPNDRFSTVVTEMPCFCQGTMILTPAGEVPVEDLRIGDLVTTLSGAVQPIAWVGQGRSLVTGANPGARPIIVHAGALAESVPRRDLHLTRGHSLYLDGVLIPVECLVNDRSIVWDEAVRVVEFYHIELPRHGVLLANGAPAESYKENANHALFHNADRPAFAPGDSGWYAPVRDNGPEVEAAWRRLLLRSGFVSPPLSADPDLHLRAEGVRVNAVWTSEGLVRFRLERRPGRLQIVSRSFRPSEIGVSRDTRCLGVALRRVVLESAGMCIELAADAAMLTEGFNEPEAPTGLRWTTGDATVPPLALVPFGGAFDVVLDIAAVGNYPLLADTEPSWRKRAA
ncbi:MAG: Hint domain-containing protein [Alphaproteobacteria bacterium]|nr:Hint domain-containing protein [Alphaproteobacteria bacterium]